MEPEPPGDACFWPGDAFFGLEPEPTPVWSESESAPGPRTSGAGVAQKSGSSATLSTTVLVFQSVPTVYYSNRRLKVALLEYCKTKKLKASHNF